MKVITLVPQEINSPKVGQADCGIGNVGATYVYWSIPDATNAGFQTLVIDNPSGFVNKNVITFFKMRGEIVVRVQEIWALPSLGFASRKVLTVDK
jgi:hypothetical protein